MLAVLTREQLDRSIFPLGDSTKAQVRAEAAERGLAVADKPDSHDICFIADGDTRGFLAGRLGEAPGDVVDASTGAVVGSHTGAYAYTVGQRRGPAPGPARPGRPAALRALHHPEDQHGDRRPGRGAGGVRGPRRPSGLDRRRTPGRPGRVRGAAARARRAWCRRPSPLDGDTLHAELRQPVRGVAAGQAVVAYRPDPAGDVVLGSATITG